MNTPEFQSLPDEARTNFKLGEGVCTWHEEFMQWAEQFYSAIPHEFFEVASIWLLSTVAARRIVIPYGTKRTTSFFIALVAPPTFFAKSSLLDVTQDVIIAAGLGFLLLTEPDLTPKTLWRELTGCIPPNFDEIGETAQAFLKKRWAFAAQRGWAYGEFGEQLPLIMSDKSPFIEYHHLFRAIGDDRKSIVSNSIMRKPERLNNPYLTILSSMTLPDCARYAKTGSPVWGDGLFGRITFVYPHEQAFDIAEEAYPAGTYVPPPAALTLPLAQWHQRLGIPTFHIEKEGKGKRAVGDQFPENEMPLAPDVTEAFTRYYKALRRMARTDGYGDLVANYIRLCEKCLRVAALFASLDGQTEITLPYWAKAQSITEDWREDLHTLYRDIVAKTQYKEKSRPMKYIR